MFIIITQQIRKSVDIPFFKPQTNEDPDWLAHFNDTYVLTGKFISTDTDVRDPLILRTTTFWESEADRNEFMTDPLGIEHIFAPRDLYFKTNDITLEVVSSTTI